MAQDVMRVLLADDEPLVLIGLQSLLDWKALGYQICGTARNGQAALEMIEKNAPDIVIADIKMPRMDGLELARRCHERAPLPVFIMLTSYEEFEFVRSAMGAGAVDYLIKLELTAENLTAALQRAAAVAAREQSYRERVQPEMQAGFLSYRDRFLLRLYTGLIKDEAELNERIEALGLVFRPGEKYVVASCDLVPKSGDLTPEQLIRLSFSTARLIETTLENHLPCFVTGMDVKRLNVLLCLDEAAAQDMEAFLKPLLLRTSQIVHNYFTVTLYWAVAEPVSHLLALPRRCRELEAFRPLLCEQEPVLFSHQGAENDATEHKAQTVARIQQYIREHLSERLSLNDVAAVFNFSPNYTSQLFAKYGTSSFVEYVTEMRIAAAKEMLEQGDLKIYEIAEKLGFDSAFYFSKVFKKVTGQSPREYQKML